MRFDLGRNGHVTAATTFYGLVFLAFGLLVTLSGLLSHFIMRLYDACASVWDNLLLRATSPGVLLPMAVAGSVVSMAGFTLVRHWWATRRVVKRLAPYRVSVPARLARVAQQVGLADRVECVSGVIIAPFCYGFIRPRVCVPIALLSMLDDSELRAVLRHEGYHAQNRDPLKVWLSRALARGLYFLPLAGDLRDSYLAAKEIAADEVIAQMDELPLASALVKLLSANDREAPELCLATQFGPRTGETTVAGLISVTREPANDTEERIWRLIDGRPVRLRLPTITSVFLSAVIVIAIFATSYVNLSAASTASVSQECATEKAFGPPDTSPELPFDAFRDTVLGIEWSTLSRYEHAGDVVQVVAGSPIAPGRASCDLLTPICRDQYPAISEHALESGY